MESASPAPAGDLVVPETIQRNDPVVRAVREFLKADVGEIGRQVPRDPTRSAQLLEIARNSHSSANDLLVPLRRDPRLCGKLLELSNSALYAGSEPVHDVRKAVVRVGLEKVADLAAELSGEVREARERPHLVERLDTFSFAVAVACEQLSAMLPGDPIEGTYLVGLLHAVAAPAIVLAIGQVERTKGIEATSDARVLGLVQHLSSETTNRVLRAWNVPREIREAVRRQDGSARDRHARPLAQLLVAAKAFVTELGIGAVPEEIDITSHSEMKRLGLDDEVVLFEVGQTVRRAVAPDPPTED